MVVCPNDVSEELYKSKDSYPICKECPYVSTYGKCPYLKQYTALDALTNAYSNMSEEELRQELEEAERDLFGW